MASLQSELETKSKEWRVSKEDAVHSLTINAKKKEEETSKKHEEQISTMKKEYEERMTQFQFLYMKEEKQRKKLEKDLE